MEQLLYATLSLGAFALIAGITLLPQTQCGQCGFPGCRPYANAVAGGEADVNHCVPGGERTMLSIADLMGVEPKALDEEEPCPVDCIDMIQKPELLEHWSWPLPDTKRAQLGTERRESHHD